jgi:DNA polymerase I
VTLDQAKETVERWYNDRPEVRQWQKCTIEQARMTGYTKTLMGRWRKLSDITSRKYVLLLVVAVVVGASDRPETLVDYSPRLRAHAERAAINTPLQGGAADIVMKAMLQLHKDEALQATGWKLILQIHDELILEGPKATRDIALERVLHCMRNPIDPPLLVELVVDAHSADTWLDAK